MQARPDLIVQRPEGLYCPPGDFYIDPWRPVRHAVITHAHADHARRGHGHYLTATPAECVLRARLGDIDLQSLDYGERITHRGVTLSLHPAGHVLGMAQVREYRGAGGGQVGVASGDYKVAPDATCDPFEPVACDVFITESPSACRFTVGVLTRKSSLVFEFGFEGINHSSRHKSGIAVRFPRMLRTRDDKPLHEANTLDELKSLLN